MSLVGWVDSFSNIGIQGWVGDTSQPNQPISIDIWIRGKCIGKVVSDIHRPDVEAAGVGNGHKGFFYRWPDAPLKKMPAEVFVRFSGTNELVPNGSLILDEKRSDSPSLSFGRGLLGRLRSFLLREKQSDANPWNEAKPFDYSTLWLGTKICIEHINQRITGDPQVHPFTYYVNKFVMSRGHEAIRHCRALLLGASEGNMERELCRRGFTGEIVATDIAANALARAKQQSDALGYHNIRHVVHDLNEPFDNKFGGAFDFIFAEGVLHHVQNVAVCLEGCRDLLKPDGYLFALEFEGPFRFQLSELQVRWINSVLNLLPRDLRPFADKDHRPEYPGSNQENSSIAYVCPPAAVIARIDPSEALTGPELKRLIPDMFAVVERAGFGGTLLSYMTNHFNFKRANIDPYAARWLKVLIELERTLIDTGILDDEFVSYILRKKVPEKGCGPSL